MFKKLLENDQPTIRENKNERGQTVSVEFLDKEGNLVERETYEYDEHGYVSRRNTYRATGALEEYEVFVRDGKGKLLQHERRDASGKPYYIEKWTGDGDGKTLFAEAWHYDESGDVTDYKRLVPNKQGHLVNPKRQWSIVFTRAVCMILGVLCMFTAIEAFTAGNTGLAVFAAAITLLNFWNAVKKR